MKILAVVLTRLSSKRLPGKALMPILGVPMIELLIRRLSLSKKINQVVIAIPKNRMGKIVKREVKKIYLKKKLDLSKQIRKFLN